MNCPVCKTVELKMSERQGIEIDYCPQCRGVWLDRGELDKIIERTGAPEYTSVPQPRQPAPPAQQPQPAYPPPPPPGTYPQAPYGGGYRRDDDSDYEKGYGTQQGNRPHKKRKSLLGELFDFD